TQVLLGAGISCMFDGSFEDGNLRKDFNLEECAKGIASAVIAHQVSNFALAKLQNLDTERLKRGLLRLGIPQKEWTRFLRWVGIKNADHIAEGVEKSLEELLSGLKKVVPSDQWDKFVDDFGKDAAKLAKFDANPKLVDAWKKMDQLGADEALRRNPGTLDALSKTKGSRPDPSTYLSQKYIDGHLAKFDDGAVRFTSREAFDKYGTIGPVGGFVMPRSEFDKLLKETNKNLREVEKKLGLKEGYLGDDDTMILLIEKQDLNGIRMPSGNEGGADLDLWLPGGKTSGGVSEAVMDFSGKPPFTEINIQ